MFNLLLFGAPGSGKGTQAEFIEKELGIKRLVTGDILREEVRKQTELGMQAKSYMDRGVLVPDHLVISMIRERLLQPEYQNGILLDGFPRTVAQAQALDAMLNGLGKRIDLIIVLQVSEDELVRRLSERLTCASCGRTYSANDRINRCPYDGTILEKRSDDQPDVARKRIAVYNEQTRPVLDYYNNRVRIVLIDGQKSIQEVKTEIIGKIKVDYASELEK